MKKVHEFWACVLAQDREAIRRFFHENAWVNWHCTDEHFTVEEFLRANCEYPGEWSGEVERVETMGELTVAVVHVYPADRSASFHVVSFMAWREGKIASLDEYWADDGDAPQWRQEMGIGQPIGKIIETKEKPVPV